MKAVLGSCEGKCALGKLMAIFLVNFFYAGYHDVHNLIHFYSLLNWNYIAKLKYANKIFVLSVKPRWTEYLKKWDKTRK